MGGGYSHLESEKLTWIDHSLRFDESIRKVNLPKIETCFLIDSVFHLAYQNCEFGRLKYQHWFIADEKFENFFELWSPKGLYEARVQINTNVHPDINLDTKNGSRRVTEEIRERMKQLLGMSNYSLCLRNCEHLANFIIGGMWMSFQMEDNGDLMSYFKSTLLDNAKMKVNTFPSTLRPITVNTSMENSQRDKLYPFIEKQYTPIEYQFFLDTNEDTYNILVVGPTGAGKSRLINVLFNSDLCRSEVSHQSVTKEMCFVKGYGLMQNLETKVEERKTVIVADTIGICDTEWDDAKILNLIKGRISCNFKSIDAVFVVFRADRLLKEHVTNIKNIMSWLGYLKGNNHLNFMFVGTFSENLEEDKEKLKREAKQILGLKDTERKDGENGHDSLVYVGFPPARKLNEEGKQQIKDSWDLLQPLLRLQNGSALSKYGEVMNMSKAHGWRLSVPNWSKGCNIL